MKSADASIAVTSFIFVLLLLAAAFLSILPLAPYRPHDAKSVADL
jgi:hypothetical protein